MLLSFRYQHIKFNKFLVSVYGSVPPQTNAFLVFVAIVTAAATTIEQSYISKAVPH
jgi:hypothetical protein